MAKNSKSHLVLAGFLGAVTYTPTSYGFEDGKHLFPASLFSVALKQYLERHRPDGNLVLWLVLGTPESVWAALGEAVSVLGKADNEFLELQADVAAVRPTRENKSPSGMNDELLGRWSAAISDRIGLEVRCQFIGSPEKPENQYDIWRALESVGKNDEEDIRYEIVFDITNGLRHQPVIASYSVMMLRWLRQIEKVNFCYGAFDIKSKTNDGKEYNPAIFLPACEELTRACEAFARYKFTGDYRGLGEELRIGDEFNKKLGTVAYHDEVNRPEKQEADELRQYIEKAENELSPIAKSFVQRVKNALDWTAYTRLDRQYERKAEKAFESEQYFQAVAYLYEALVLADCYAHLKGVNFLSFPKRQKRVWHPPKSVDPQRRSELEKCLNTDQLAVFRKITYIRNGVLHGTKSEDKDIGPEVENIIAEPKRLKETFETGRKLFTEMSYPGRR